MKTPTSTLDKSVKITAIVIGAIIGTAAIINLLYHIGRLIGKIIAPLL